MSPVRLTLCNHLSGHAAAESTLGVDHLQKFILDCLDYPHWVQNRAQLGSDLKDLVEKHADPELFAMTQTDSFRWPQTLQVMELEQTEDFHFAVQKHLESELGSTPIRYIFDTSLKKLLALVLHASGELEIRFFDRKFLIWQGELRPLKADRRLQFNSDLELKNGVQQRVEIAPYITAQFVSENDQLTGSVIRGYIFQKLLELKGDPIESAPKIFYFLRKIENHFLKRDSNPFYLGLVAELEKHIQLLRLGDEQAQQLSADLAARAQNALEYVFGSDKLLALLIKDLHNTLNQTQVAHESQNSPPNFSRSIEQTAL